MNHFGIPKGTVIVRSRSNAHRYFCVINGKLKQFCTDKKAIPTLLASLFGLLLGYAPAYAQLPTGYESVSWNVQFSQPDANTLNVTTAAQRSIAQYQTFNVGQNQAVNFNLPNSSSAILNRVVGGNPSQILGSLRSNGQVFLVNPSGIIFGTSAQVQVGALFASTLDISNADFLNGNMVFSKSPGVLPASVVNEGHIETLPGGFTVLAGSAVQNSGNIYAPGGSVNLTVGDQVSMNLNSDVAVKVTVDEKLHGKVADVQQAIQNTGTISAPGGFVSLQAKLADSLYDQIINNSGTIEANSIVERNGQIELVGTSDTGNGLVINAGKIDASGTSEAPDGGNILLAGDIVSQRGEVLAEGNQNGTGGKIEITSSPGTVLRAGSMTSARGAAPDSHAGEITIWSDTNTWFLPGAKIDVSGGSHSGNGGFAEVSAFETVYFNGAAQGGANQGLGGKILIDPNVISIINSGPGVITGQPDGTPDVSTGDPGTSGFGLSEFDPQAGHTFTGFDEVYLQAASIIAINSTFNVPIATGNPGSSIILETTNTTGELRVSAPLITNSGNITLRAFQGDTTARAVDININSDVTSSTGNIILLAGNLNAGTPTYGAITVSAGTSVATSGSITLSGNTFVLGSVEGSDITITSSGDLTLGAASSLVAGNTASLRAGGNLSQAEGGSIVATHLILNATGTIGGTWANTVLDGTTTNLTVGNLNTPTTVSYQDTDGLSIAGAQSSDDMSITAATGNLVVAGDVTISGNNNTDDLFLGATAGTLSFNNTSTLTAHNISLLSGNGNLLKDPSLTINPTNLTLNASGMIASDLSNGFWSSTVGTVDIGTTVIPTTVFYSNTSDLIVHDATASSDLFLLTDSGKIRTTGTLLVTGNQNTDNLSLLATGGDVEIHGVSTLTANNLYLMSLGGNITQSGASAVSASNLYLDGTGIIGTVHLPVYGNITNLTIGSIEAPTEAYFAADSQPFNVSSATASDRIFLATSNAALSVSGPVTVTGGDPSDIINIEALHGPVNLGSASAISATTVVMSSCCFGINQAEGGTIQAETVALSADGDIRGVGANSYLDLDTDILIAESFGNISIRDPNDIRLFIAGAPNGTLNLEAGGDMTLAGLVLAQSFNLTANNLLNVSPNSISATSDSTFTIMNSAGSLADPIDLNVIGGGVTGRFFGSSVGYSGVFTGTIAPSNLLIVRNNAPAPVLFNGVVQPVILPSTPTPAPSPSPAPTPAPFSFDPGMVTNVVNSQGIPYFQDVFNAFNPGYINAVLLDDQTSSPFAPKDSKNVVVDLSVSPEDLQILENQMMPEDPLEP